MSFRDRLENRSQERIKLNFQTYLGALEIDIASQG